MNHWLASYGSYKQTIAHGGHSQARSYSSLARNVHGKCVNLQALCNACNQTQALQQAQSSSVLCKARPSKGVDATAQ